MTITGSKSGDALEALFDVIVAAAAANPDVLTDPRQNEDTAMRLQALENAEKVWTYLNVWDGTPAPPEEMLGADEEEIEGNEIDLPVTIEWIVAAVDRSERRTKFETGLTALHDAIVADRTLGGTVDYLTFGSPERTGSGLITDGMPNVLAATITVTLQIKSGKPL